MGQKRQRIYFDGSRPGQGLDRGMAALELARQRQLQRWLQRCLQRGPHNWMQTFTKCWTFGVVGSRFQTAFAKMLHSATSFSCLGPLFSLSVNPFSRKCGHLCIRNRKEPKSVLPRPNHTANLLGFVLGCIEADSCNNKCQQQKHHKFGVR